MIIFKERETTFVSSMLTCSKPNDFATACLPGEGPFADTSLLVTHLTGHLKARRNCRRQLGLLLCPQPLE